MGASKAVQIGDSVRVVIRQAGSLRKTYDYGIVVDRGVGGTDVKQGMPSWAADGQVWLLVSWDDGTPSLWVQANADVEQVA